jgi:hypothetical protein
MMFKFLKIIGIGFILSVSTLANATFIDNRVYTTDTESGFDWTGTVEDTHHYTAQISVTILRTATANEAGGLMSKFFMDGLGFGLTSPEFLGDGSSSSSMAVGGITAPSILNSFPARLPQCRDRLMFIGGDYDRCGFGGEEPTDGIELPVYVVPRGIALVPATTVSEPAIIALFALGLVGIGFARRR